MAIGRSEFVCSSPTWQQCPRDGRPEVAFVGRSNVGKSSLINMLTNTNTLAKVSSTPGKTQLINHFLINDHWYLVDLPGYGYAKTPKATRAGFGRMIRDYALYRESLYCLFILIDARLSPQRNDLEFLGWAGEHEVPLSLIFTKTDKLSAGALDRNIALYRETLQETWEELPPHFATSAITRQGRDEVVAYIESFV